VLKLKKRRVKCKNGGIDLIMGLPKEKKEKIIHYLLTKIQEEDKKYAKKTADAFNVSLTTVYRYISELCHDKVLIKESKDFKYRLAQVVFERWFDTNKNLEEDIIYRKYIEPYICDLPSNINKIWEYSFSEMFNNAIDHSESSKIYVKLRSNYLSTTIMIFDLGVGIFEKIRKYFGYDKLDDAITELFKGKLTTDPERHSGEGIFFTSRALDAFIAWSDDKIFTHNNDHEGLYDVKKSTNHPSDNEGTSIFMRLSNFSRKQLSEVFDEFATVEGGFNMTKIPIKNLFDNAHPISRSQAKRLYNRLDKFDEVVLDFEGVESIGQGFAHEIFVVFKRTHPDLNLEVINDNEEVRKMINHVLTTK